jgi:hypothetical protein
MLADAEGTMMLGNPLTQWRFEFFTIHGKCSSHVCLLEGYQEQLEHFCSKFLGNGDILPSSKVQDARRSLQL